MQNGTEYRIASQPILRYLNLVYAGSDRLAIVHTSPGGHLEYSELFFI